MTSDDRPPMPASPPPAHEPPPAPAPPPPPAAARPGELVDSVPGVTPAEPAKDLLGGLILPSDLPTWAPAATPAPAEPVGPAPVEPAPAEPAPGEGDAGDTIPVATFLSQLAEAHQRPEAAAPPAAPTESADDAGDTIAASAGSFDHLILPPEPSAAAAEETQRGFPSADAAPAPAPAPAPASAPEAFAPPGFAPPGFSPPPGFTPPAGFEPPSGFQPAPGFAPPGYNQPGHIPPGQAGYDQPGQAADSDFGLAAPTMVGASRFQPPAAGGAHAGDTAPGGRGKLAALIGGVIVLAALIVGGVFLFHGSSKKSPVAAPTPRAVVSAAPSAAPTSAAPSVAPSSAAPSPTVDAALAGTQAKALQNTVIKPLKSLVALDASSAGAEESCMVDQASAFSARGAQRTSLLAMLRKLDVTAMQDNKTWKGLLEQAMLKDITVDKELTAFAKDLKTTCKPATVKNDAHYKKAIAAHEASLSIQKKFVAAFNPVAKAYHIPQQSAGNI